MTSPRHCTAHEIDDRHCIYNDDKKTTAHDFQFFDSHYYGMFIGQGLFFCIFFCFLFFIVITISHLILNNGTNWNAMNYIMIVGEDDEE